MCWWCWCRVILKNCVPFTICKSKINNTVIDDPKYIDTVKPIYNSIEYSNNCSKTYGSLWRYCKEIPAVDNDVNITNFNGAKATYSFNFKAKITVQADNNGRIDNVEIMIPLKYLSNFGRNLICR